MMRALIPVGGGLVPSFSASVFRHLTVHRYGHKLVAFGILELDDLMAAPGKLTLTARLIWVLLNRCVLGSPHGEGHGP
jgi:hypothetical protein